MRLSERLYRGNREGLYCDTGRVTNSVKGSVAAQGTGGASQLSMVTPGGVEYVPDRDDEAVILWGNKRRLFIGKRRNTTSNNLKPGELLLYSKGGASIYLTNEGEIRITGTVTINGEPLEVT